MMAGVMDELISRRGFGQVIGSAALGGALQSLGSSPASAQTSSPAAAPVGKPDDLCDLSAVDLAARIRRKEVSAREVMAAHLARIERVNPKVNAIVTLVADRAMADAARADEQTARGGALGPLHGLPVAHKDLVDTAGIRTTRGSPFYRDNVPTRDALIVTRMRAAGAITCGKTNTPEFGAGSQTFNTVFGATRNPYDLTKTVRRQQRRRGGGARRAAWCRSPTAATRAARCAIRRRSATSSAFGRRPAACRERRLVVAAVGVGPDGAHRRRRRAVPERRSRATIRAIRSPSPKTAPASARRSSATSRACASRGGKDSAAFRSSPRSAASWTPTGGRSRISAASSRRRSRISPASTKRSRSCGSQRIIRVRAARPRSGPSGSRTRSNGRSPRPSASPAPTSGARHGAAGADVRAEPHVLRALRLLRAAGDAGRAVRREHAVSRRASPARRWRPTSIGCAPAGT